MCSYGPVSDPRGSYRLLRIGMGSCGVLQVYMDPYGPLWVLMDSYGHLWTLTGLYGLLWTPMDSCGPLWAAMELYASVWAPMDPYRSLWTPMDLCGLLQLEIALSHKEKVFFKPIYVPHPIPPPHALPALMVALRADGVFLTYPGKFSAIKLWDIMPSIYFQGCSNRNSRLDNRRFSFLSCRKTGKIPNRCPLPEAVRRSSSSRPPEEK